MSTTTNKVYILFPFLCFHISSGQTVALGTFKNIREKKAALSKLLYLNCGATSDSKKMNGIMYMC